MRVTLTGTARVLLEHRSAEPWNPIAAVELAGFRLPPGIHPQLVDLRIPIPDLYGFASSAAVAICSERLLVGEADNLQIVPFCEQIAASVVAAQSRFYADIRENSERLVGSYTICVTPTELPERFTHLTLAKFVSALLAYLANPVQSVQREIAEITLRAQVHGTTADQALRLAHLLEGIGEIGAATQLLMRGTELFPLNPWIRARYAATVRTTGGSVD